MAAHKKYILTEKDQLFILKMYLTGAKKLNEIYVEHYKSKFKTIAAFNNYNTKYLLSNNRLTQLALGCKLPEDGKVIGSKDESYWKDEKEVLFKPATISELGQDEQNILLNLEYKF